MESDVDVKKAGSDNLLKGKRILVVDDHRNIRISLRYTLEGEGARIDETDNFNGGRDAMLAKGPDSKPIYDVILLDLRLQDGSGLDLLKLVENSDVASRVIMISGEGTASDAFLATQRGAFDFIEKPFTPERILVSVRRCLEFSGIRKDNLSLKEQVARGQEILGESQKIKDTLALIKRVAATGSRVLILGESGTGKELVAKAIHRASDRASMPLIKVNCAAIPHSLIESELFGHEKGAFTGALKTRRGLFEQAHGGTLFLDEIGELSADVQAKLLRALQSGEIIRVGSEKTITVDVRLLCATHRDLPEMVKNGQFREDLFYRLNVVTIPLPALRERKEDIPLLAQFFLDLACRENALGKRFLAPQALEQLKTHNWPGNIRELRNILERAAVLCEGEMIEEFDTLTARAPQNKEVTKTDLAAVGAFHFDCSLSTWDTFHEQAERSYVKFVLHAAKGNVSEAARMLCLERAYLHRLMKKLGIHRDVVVSD